MTAVILFVDLLGARNKWKTGGVPAATRAFNEFADLVLNALRPEAPGSIRRGGIETDSAMIAFDTPLAALRTARRLFCDAFRKGKNADASRLWLRGSLVAADDNASLRREAQLAAPFDRVSMFTYSTESLDAISIEKGGFKGMRFLIRPEVIDRAAKEALRLPLGDFALYPFRRLSHSSYPDNPGGEIQDFLWMACGDEAEWQRIARRMSSRLRYSARDPEEFIQAAATQVVFHECGAIRQSLAVRS